LAPEIIKRHEYSFAADIWALGVLLYEMAALKVPFNGINIQRLSQSIISAKFKPLPAHFSPTVTGMLKQILQKDPAKRPKINEILKWPEIEKRIGSFLQEDTYKMEFAHTVMHGCNVFAEFKKSKKEKESTATTAPTESSESKEDTSQKKEAVEQMTEHLDKLQLDQKDQTKPDTVQSKPDQKQLEQMIKQNPLFEQHYNNFMESIKKDYSDVESKGLLMNDQNSAAVKAVDDSEVVDDE
jgi:serine/threonine protein kinase